MTVVTTPIYPPSPDRNHDWQAHFEGDEEGATGFGDSEAAAIMDLMDNIEGEQE